MFGNKKNKLKRKKKEKTLPSSKVLKVLNFVTPGYRQTCRFADYTDPDKFKKAHIDTIKKSDVDDLCANMYDPEIKSEANLMKVCAEDQRINNYEAIDYSAGILGGDIKMFEQILLYCEEDLVSVNNKQAELEAIKKKGATA